MARSAALPLTPDTLPVLPERVAAPRYDRRRLHPSIVHIGVGGFHRAHQAVYLDDLGAAGGTWGELGVGLLPQDRAMASALGAQDGLYTLLVRGDRGDTARVVGPLLRHLFAPDNQRAVLLALSSPGTQLVTMTITEAGYNVDETTGSLTRPTMRCGPTCGTRRAPPRSSGISQRHSIVAVWPAYTVLRGVV